MELSDLYGSEFLNPSATPMLIVDKSGEVHALPIGIKSLDELNEAIKTYLNSDM